MRIDPSKWFKKRSEGKASGYKDDSNARIDECSVAPNNIIELAFEERSIGLTTNDYNGTIVVTSVMENSEAERRGVQSGDIVLQVNRMPVHSSQSFGRSMSSIKRPVLLTFRKKKGLYLFDSVGMSVQKWATPNSQSQLSEDERNEQRKAMLSAAEARTKQWDNRLQRKRQADAKISKSSPSNNGVEVIVNPVTKQIVENCLNQEKETTQSLGYNPYEAKMVSHNEARQSVSISKSPSDTPPFQLPNNDVARRRTDILEEEQIASLGIMEEIDASLSQIISCGDDIVITSCIETLDKLLTNMITKKDEKFRKIRLANPAFSSKVAAVPGGMDVMINAGFELKSDEVEAYLFYSEAWDPPALRLRVALQRLNLVKECTTD